MYMANRVGDNIVLFNTILYIKPVCEGVIYVYSTCNFYKEQYMHP